MFEKARLKLTAWYLVIIMAISLGFSATIYASIDKELVRMDNIRKERQVRVEIMRDFIIQRGFPPPQEGEEGSFATLGETRLRIITILGLINASILLISGLGGYFLAGQTLEPISKMVKEQKEFVSNASHELRTPLTSLKTEIEVALRAKNMTLLEAKNLLKSNLEDVNSMERLSNYLLELNRSESMESGLEMEKINLGEVVKNTLESIDSNIKKNNVEVIKNITPVWVVGEKGAVKEIASILIDNAIKYSGKEKKIEVSVVKGGKLIVKDYGIGIAKEDIPNIFDRFYRVEASRSKEKVDGYGLGLSIAKSLADKMGAKIRVQSKIGKGSSFNVRFPLA